MSPTENELFTVGHTPFTHAPSDIAAYVLYGHGLNLVLHSELMDLDSPREGLEVVDLKTREWKLDDLRSIVTKWQQFGRDEGFWNS